MRAFICSQLKGYYRFSILLHHRNLRRLETTCDVNTIPSPFCSWSALDPLPSCYLSSWLAGLKSPRLSPYPGLPRQKLRYLSLSFPLLSKSSEHREEDQIWTVADPVMVLGGRRMLIFTVSSNVWLPSTQDPPLGLETSALGAQADQTPELLGVGRTATPDEIKKAYRKVRISILRTHWRQPHILTFPDRRLPYNTTLTKSQKIAARKPRQSSSRRPKPTRSFAMMRSEKCMTSMAWLPSTPPEALVPAVPKST